jgi:hypothetical protein
VEVARPAHRITTQLGVATAVFAARATSGVLSLDELQVSAEAPLQRHSRREDEGMIVIGADTHKQSHTVAAVSEATGRPVADLTVAAKRRALDDVLEWARGLDDERIWAIEDGRHVSEVLERFCWSAGNA